MVMKSRYSVIWRFPKIGVPPVIHFTGIFHYKSSSYWVLPIMETPIITENHHSILHCWGIPTVGTPQKSYASFPEAKGVPTTNERRRCPSSLGASLWPRTASWQSQRWARWAAWLLGDLVASGNQTQWVLIMVNRN